jgi:SMI1 / KNR4 family (SUKH-1)
MNATSDLLSKLIELKASLLPPPSEEEVTNAEKALESRFPDGIREFYRCCNGVKETTDDLNWDFYSLERMIDRTRAYREQDSLIVDSGEIVPFKDLVCFCDVLIELNTYHFCGNPKSRNYGKFYGSTQNLGWFVAETYEAFVQVFLQQHKDLILGLETESP